MDMIQFSNNIPPDQLINIFRDFFEQHIATYNILKGIHYMSVNVTTSASSILYCIKLLDDEDIHKVEKALRNITIGLYGNIYKPEVFINGDLLCITFRK